MTSIDEIASDDSDKEFDSVDVAPVRAMQECDYATNRAIEMQSSYIASSFVGIPLAGCAYPTILFLLITLGSLASLSSIRFEESLLLLGLAMLVGSTVGVVVSACTAIVAIPLVIAMNRSLGDPLDARSAAISAGSLAGYIPTSWVLFAPEFTSDFAHIASAGFLGPILAMILGACGAAWSCSTYGGLDIKHARLRNKYRLGIGNVMLATTWIAVIFSIANYFGGFEFAVAVAVWFALQAIMLFMIYLYRRLQTARNKIRTIQGSTSIH